MTIGTVDNLRIVEVYDHGIPNQERFAIYVSETCDLSEYCVMLGMPGVAGNSTPIKDHMLWFGQGYACKGDWIIVYTASGQTTYTTLKDSSGNPTNNRLISVHWGKDLTVFQNRAISPILVRIGEIGIVTPPPPQFQGKPQKQTLTWGGH